MDRPDRVPTPVEMGLSVGYNEKPGANPERWCSLTQEKTGTITIYTHPDCSYSDEAKDDFRRRGIEYHEIDVSSDPAAGALVERLAGERITPVIVDGDEVVVGFNGMG